MRHKVGRFLAGIASIPTTLAVSWGDVLWNEVSAKAKASGLDTHETDMREIDYIAAKADSKTRLDALVDVVDRLQKDFAGPLSRLPGEALFGRCALLHKVAEACVIASCISPKARRDGCHFEALTDPTFGHASCLRTSRSHGPVTDKASP